MGCSDILLSPTAWGCAVSLRSESQTPSSSRVDLVVFGDPRQGPSCVRALPRAPQQLPAAPSAVAWGHVAFSCLWGWSKPRTRLRFEACFSILAVTSAQ